MNHHQQKWMTWSMRNIIVVFKDNWLQKISTSVIVQKLWSKSAKDQQLTVRLIMKHSAIILDELGDSLLVVNDEEIIKVHVHTENPGEVMNYGQKFGFFVKIKVDNMRLQHETILEHDVNPSAQRKPTVQPYGIIAIAAGEWIKELFTSLGASYVISGGQTMNPSTEDIVTAIKK